MVGESQDKLNKSCTRRCSICESQRPQICQSSCRERWCGRQCELFSFAIRWFQPGDRLAVQNLRPTSRLQQHVRILAKIHPNALSRQARMRNLESNKLGRWKTGTIALKGSYAVDRSCILEQEVLHLWFPGHYFRRCCTSWLRSLETPRPAQTCSTFQRRFALVTAVPSCSYITFQSFCYNNPSYLLPNLSALVDSFVQAPKTTGFELWLYVPMVYGII